MGKQRQSWSVEEKLGIVLAVLSERQSVAEVARQRGGNENQIYRWKEQFLAAGRHGWVKRGKGADGGSAAGSGEWPTQKEKGAGREGAGDRDFRKSLPVLKMQALARLYRQYAARLSHERVHARDGTTVLAVAVFSTGWRATPPARAGSGARGCLGTSGGGSATDLRVSSGLPGALATASTHRARTGSAVDGRFGFTTSAAHEEKASGADGGGRARLAAGATAPN